MVRRFALLGLIVAITGGFGHRTKIRSVTNGDFMAVDNFLERYGYMEKSEAHELKTHTTLERTNALRSFQDFFGLPVTGELDDATITLMNKPRCGVPDPVSKQDGRPSEYKLGPKWDKTSLTYKWTRFTDQLSQEIQRSEMERAFNAWSDVTDIYFTEDTSNAADIKLLFAKRNHGDRGPFDGRGGTLAHAFYPLNGDIHYDDDEQWQVNTTDASGVDFFIVALHEIGHSLGLDHSKDNNAVMAPSYPGYDANNEFTLTSDDITGVQQHYGPKTNASPAPLPTSDTSTGTPVRPAPPTSRDRRPGYCKKSFDAVFQDYDGYVNLIRGRQILVTDELGLYANGIVKDFFRLAPRTISDGFTKDNKVYFVQGPKIYEYDLFGAFLDVFFLNKVQSPLPEKPRAVYSTSNGDVYMIGKSFVWQVDLDTESTVCSSIKNFADEFPGVPNKVDAATIMNDDMLYLFKGNGFYVFNVTSSTLEGGPYDIGSEFSKGECQL